MACYGQGGRKIKCRYSDGTFDCVGKVMLHILLKSSDSCNYVMFIKLNASSLSARFLLIQALLFFLRNKRALLLLMVWIMH